MYINLTRPRRKWLWTCLRVFSFEFQQEYPWVCTKWSNTTYKTWFYSRFQGWNRYLWCKMTCAYYYHLTISNLLTVVLINGAFPLLEIMCWGLGRLTASPHTQNKIFFPLYVNHNLTCPRKNDLGHAWDYWILAWSPIESAQNDNMVKHNIKNMILLPFSRLKYVFVM